MPETAILLQTSKGQEGHVGGQKGAREDKKGAREGKKGTAPFYFDLLERCYICHIRATLKNALKLEFRIGSIVT